MDTMQTVTSQPETDFSLQIKDGRFVLTFPTHVRNANGDILDFPLSHEDNLIQTAWNTVARLDEPSIRDWLGTHSLANVPASPSVDRLISEDCQQYVNPLYYSALGFEEVVNREAEQLLHPLNFIAWNTRQVNMPHDHLSLSIKNVARGNWSHDYLDGVVTISAPKGVELRNGKHLGFTKENFDGLKSRLTTLLNPQDGDGEWSRQIRLTRVLGVIQIDFSRMLMGAEQEWLAEHPLSLEDFQLWSTDLLPEPIMCEGLIPIPVTEDTLEKKTRAYMDSLLDLHEARSTTRSDYLRCITDAGEECLAQLRTLSRPSHISLKVWSDVIHELTAPVVGRAIDYARLRRSEGQINSEPFTLESLSVDMYPAKELFKLLNEESSAPHQCYIIL